jgi:hypothetical protein
MLQATLAGTEPPVTNPKYRGPAVATVAGEPISSRSERTSLGERECSGRGIRSF